MFYVILNIVSQADRLSYLCDMLADVDFNHTAFCGPDDDIMAQVSIAIPTVAGVVAVAETIATADTDSLPDSFYGSGDTADQTNQILELVFESHR